VNQFTLRNTTEQLRITEALDLYSGEGGAWFKISAVPPVMLRPFVGVLRPSRIIYRLGKARFLFNLFQFIINQFCR
jgi:hypothetical protein